MSLAGSIRLSTTAARSPACCDPTRSRSLRPIGIGRSALQLVRVHRHVLVAEEHPQLRLAFARMRQRLRQRVARQQPLACELLVDPGEELLHQRLGVLQSVQPLALAARGVLADVGLDLADIADPLQRLVGRLRLGVQRLEEAASRVRPQVLARVQAAARRRQHGVVAATGRERVVCRATPPRDARGLQLSSRRRPGRCRALAQAGWQQPAPLLARGDRGRRQ